MGSSLPLDGRLLHEGSCRCGAVRVGLCSAPLLAYRCHCSNCRGFASKFTNNVLSYNQAIWCWKWSCVVIHGQETLEWERTSGFYGLFAMHRGRCSKCKTPVVERGAANSLAYPYCMVMAPPLTGIEPDTNIFWDSGTKEPSDQLATTIHSDWGSLLFEVYILLTLGLWRLPGSIWGRLRHHLTAKKLL